jgi:aminoglycoside phosphotransferase (APT) family kinase protein
VSQCGLRDATEHACGTPRIRRGGACQDAAVKAVDVVLANNDRVTVRVGDIFLKIDADPDRSAREVEAMTLAPVPTPEVLWRTPPVLALARVLGAPLDEPGRPSIAPPAAWASAGATIRRLHDAPLPPWPTPYTNAGRWESVQALEVTLDEECHWLVERQILPTDVVERNRSRARSVLRPWQPVFIHGDLHIEHVLVDGVTVTGILDWSEAAPGDAAFDLASLTLAHPDRLGDLLAGYGDDVDRDRIHAWWSYRCLTVLRWLIENGYGPPDDYPEVAMLRSVT